MKSFNGLMVRALVGICWLCGLTVQAKTFVLPPGELEMRGGWRYEQDPIQKGAKRFLFADGQSFRTPAAGAVEIPSAGKWRVWVRSRDFANDRPGTRMFSLRLGEKTLERNFGTHGQVGENGWAWEDGGTLELPAGPLLVVVGEMAKHSARFESILFTDNMGYTPEGVSWELKKERAITVPLEAAAQKKLISVPAPLSTVEEKPAAVLENKNLRVTFHQAGKEIGIKIATRGATGWQPLNEDAGLANWTVVARSAGKVPLIRKGDIYPDWDATESPLVELAVAGAAVRTRKSNFSSAPWESGQCSAQRPVAAKQVDEKTVELAFATTSQGTLSSRWTLEGSDTEVKIVTSFEAKAPGYFSLGFHAPLAVEPEQADSWLLPFQFQGDRFPAKPVLIMNSATPTPLVLVNKGGVSCALVAEPESIPSEWQTGSSARYGFGLRNERGEAQPMIYAPVMGLGEGAVEQTKVEAKFRLRVQRGDWYAAYRKVADEDFKVRDYREPTTFSMTDTVFNLIDLIRNEEASGWDAKAKGVVQIESRNVVSQSSPLAYMSLYLLTGDDDLYQRFARPSLEFMISRPSAHFAIEKEIGDRYYAHQPMRGPVKMYGAATFASAYAMTHGRSPVFAEHAFQKGKPRFTAGGHVQTFDDLVILHRVTGEQRWLDQAVKAADGYISRLKEKNALREPGDHAFVNVGYASNWEGLLYLAETTGETRFRDAAAVEARALLTTVWTQPMVRDQEITLNPGGVYDHARGIWWWGDGKKRLGIYEGPAQEGPIPTEPPKIAERKVPAWTVSNVGLGLEHPFTYVRGAGQANIMMSNWAPNFLRLAALSGDDAFRVAARNSMIGRYANYPGYYLDGQTDEFRRADYPVKGPDITSLYLHHIPTFAASVVDFLFTEAELRSGGKVKFPTVRQCGYVWFDNRLWGHAPGSFYGQEAWPWLHRTAVTLDNPAVDHVLAEGGGKLHVLLMNQSAKPQKVKLAFDSKVLGRALDTAALKTFQGADGIPGTSEISQGVSIIELAPRETLGLTLEGLKLDVPTHRVKPPEHFKLSETPAPAPVEIIGTEWQAKATLLQAPPFVSADLYVHLDAGLEALKSAALRYRVAGLEKRVEVTKFPFEFTVPVGESAMPIEWAVDVVLPDGSVKNGAWSSLEK